MRLQVSFTTQKSASSNTTAFIKTDDYKKNVTLSEPGDPDSHYSVYEDLHGTHIFANNDLDMMTTQSSLNMGFDHWRLDNLLPKTS